MCPSGQTAHDLRGGLLARKLAEVLLDVLNLEGALLEIVMRDVIFQGLKRIIVHERTMPQEPPMDLDPMESASAADESTTASRDRATARLTTHVAITVALLASFLGVCK